MRRIGDATLIHSCCLDAMRAMEPASVDAVVCDPPYGLEFMGKEWDAPWKQTSGGFSSPGIGERKTEWPSFKGSNRSRCGDCRRLIGQGGSPCKCEVPKPVLQDAARMRVFQDWCERWAVEALRVMKPGAHLVAFSGTRTYHRMVCAIEDAGFEIRDSIGYLSGTGPLLWVYGSGFPKSQNVSRALDEYRCRCEQERPTTVSAPREDLRDLRQGLAASNALSGGTEQDVFAGVQRGADQPEAARQDHGAEAALRDLRDPSLPAALASSEECSALLQRFLPEQDLRRPVQSDIRSRAGCDDTGGARASDGAPQRPNEPILEGRGDVPEPQGQLRQRPICEMPAGSPADGTDGRVCDGTSARDGEVGTDDAHPNRVRPSPRPRSAEQQPQQPGTLAGQPEPQARGAWPVCRGCGKPMVPDGLGSALKPSFEPIVLARKPLVGTIAANVLAHGVGALNIDATRIPAAAGDYDHPGNSLEHTRRGAADWRMPDQQAKPNPLGRWPANLLHDGSPEVLEAFARFGSDKGAAAPVHTRNGDKFRGTYGAFKGNVDEAGSTFRADTGTAARFFYSAKASKADRAGSSHPTVKPISLMQWLCRLVCPPGGTILDPFAGSGTTGAAALREGFRCILVEREAEYFQDIIRRLEALQAPGEAPRVAQLDLLEAS